MQEISTLVKDIFTMYMIHDSQSKAHHQHQNPKQQHINGVKSITDAIMDHVGCPNQWWLLCMFYLNNHPAQIL